MLSKLKPITQIIYKLFSPVTSLISRPTPRAIACFSGFLGWYLTAVKLAEMKLLDQYAGKFIDTMHSYFLISEFISLIVMTALLLMFNIQGLLSHKFFRLLPGFLLAQSSIALAMTTPNTVKAFAVIAGVTSVFGSLAALQALSEVSLKWRAFAAGFSLMIAGIIRIAVCIWIPSLFSRTSTALLVSGIAVGAISIVSVRFIKYRSKGALVEMVGTQSVKRTLRRIPYEYISFIALSTAFFFAYNSIQNLAFAQLPDTFKIFDILAWGCFIAASLFISVVIRAHNVNSLFAAGAALSGAGAILLKAAFFSAEESTLFAIFSHISWVCFLACIFLYILTFALNRPNPIFFLGLGYCAIIASEMISQILIRKYPVSNSRVSVYIGIFFVILPVGYFIMSRGLAKNGYNAENYKSQKYSRDVLSRLFNTYELSRREFKILEKLGIEGHCIDELPDILYLSESAVKKHLKSICKKTGDANVDTLLSRFKVH